VAQIERLPLSGPDGVALGDAHVALAVTLADGRRDLILARDHEAQGVTEVTAGAEPVVTTDADLCLVRLDPDGAVDFAALCHGSKLTAGTYELTLPEATDFIERPGQPE